MAKVFRPSSRESTILSKIESQKEHTRRLAINGIQDCIDPLSNSIAMKLIDENLVETTNKNSLEEQIKGCLIKHKDVVDIYGSDEDIYLNIHQQVKKYLPT
jgi:F0F1-type ATP synthase beta subunit